MHLTPYPQLAPEAFHGPTMQDPAGMPAAWVRQAQFCRMRHSFTNYGGLERQTRLRQRSRGNPTPLAFRWTGAWWVPGFQFSAGAQAPLLTRLDALYADLPEASTPWSIAYWLATPHSALGGFPPVALLPGHIATVREAARMERFFVNG